MTHAEVMGCDFGHGCIGAHSCVELTRARMSDVCPDSVCRAILVGLVNEIIMGATHHNVDLKRTA
eukprot:7667227-Pyramimonas_sp.AAC.1